MSRSESESGDNDRTRYRPDRVLIFDAHGTAHFRRVEGNSTAQTYRVPPKTTVAGLIAGLIGYPHDSYYDQFRAHNSAIAVVPQSPLRTQTMSIIQPNTDDEGHVVSGGPDDAITLPRTWGDDRAMQRNPYAYLFNVSYRFVVGLDDSETFNALQQALDTRQYEFTPCLGRRECGASLTYHGTTTIKWIDTDGIDSAIPDSAINDTDDQPRTSVVQERGTVIDTERSPAEMSADGIEDPAKKSTRQTTAWETWSVRRDGGPMTLSRSVEAAQITLDGAGEDKEIDDTVLFA